MHAKSLQSYGTLWTVACQAPLSMGFPRQEYWSGLPFPFPGDLPDPEIEPNFLYFFHWQVDSSQLSHQGNPTYTACNMMRTATTGK